MKGVACSNCGKEAKVVRGSYLFIESGLDCVTLQGIELIRCDHCDNEDPIIPRINDLMRALTLAVIFKPHRLLGNEFRFVRKYLMKTGEEMGQMLGVSKTTISKWENDEDPIGEQSDRLFRVLALAMGDRLKEKLDEIINLFPRIDRETEHVKIEINPTEMSHRYV